MVEGIARGVGVCWGEHEARGSQCSNVRILPQSLRHWAMGVPMLLWDLSLLTEVFRVYRYIDQGRNPQLYTKECLERALAKNEQVKGKIDTMKVRTEGPKPHVLHGRRRETLGLVKFCAQELWAEMSQVVTFLWPLRPVLLGGPHLDVASVWGLPVIGTLESTLPGCPLWP